MKLSAAGEHRDVRGWAFTGAIDNPKPFDASQSEIVAILRGKMHTHRPYTLEQLITDIEALTPEHLDLA